MRIAILLALGLLVGACSDDAAPSESSNEWAPPSDEYAPAITACLHDRGWDAVITDDGGVDIAMPEGQAGQYDADYEECLAETGFDRPSRPFDSESAAAYFAAMLEAAACVEGLGYVVAEPPSEEVAIEQLINGTFGIEWNPYEQPAMNTKRGDSLEQVYAECPLPGRP